MVVAESRYLAEDALDVIEVDYEPLPARRQRFRRADRRRGGASGQRNQLGRHRRNQRGRRGRRLRRGRLRPQGGISHQPPHRQPDGDPRSRCQLRRRRRAYARLGADQGVSHQPGHTGAAPGNRGRAHPLHRAGRGRRFWGARRVLRRGLPDSLRVVQVGTSGEVGGRPGGASDIGQPLPRGAVPGGGWPPATTGRCSACGPRSTATWAPTCAPTAALFRR